MKIVNLATGTVLLTMLASCSMFKAKDQVARSNTIAPANTQVQSQNMNKAATEKAMSLTEGWPEASSLAARDMIAKYGDPSEVTQTALIWRNVAPFKRIVVHRIVYSNQFPLLHQNAVEHVANFKAPTKRVEDVWKYNGAVVLDRIRGEMSASGRNEAMNILSLNLAHDILEGKTTSEQARIKHGKETFDYMNGQRTAYTQTLQFGDQINTSDLGKTITDKIRWVGDKEKASKRQAQEE